MENELSLSELKAILTSIAYSKLRISDAQNTPPDIKNDNIRELELIEIKLRKIIKNNK